MGKLIFLGRFPFTAIALLTLISFGRVRGEEEGWFPFVPRTNSIPDQSVIDLRFLNERFAGEHGRIQIQAGQFVHSTNGQAVRFWAVNGPPHGLNGEGLRRCARMLASHGVNLVRIHGGYFDKNGEVDLAKVKQTKEVVDAMKAEGIYSLLSIYFPLWLTPKPNTPWLEGYDGKQHPFAALFFNPDFQAQYRKWWTALLTTPAPGTGSTLAKEPAVAALEMLNEDSFFFWTFSERNVPDPQLRLLEEQFGKWLIFKYGSLDAALGEWKSPKLSRDIPGEGRIAMRPLWNIFNEKTRRDQDTAQFLLEVQTQFYTETRAFLRGLGFDGPITASNWSTASPEIFGPLEKLSYLAGDFVDRHGYFSCNHKGPSAEWSIRDGHTYSDRSALRFEAEDLSKPRQFVHPVMDPHYQDRPSIISETTWTRPNRYRSEAPLYLAAYGALQHSDGIVHFALDGAGWTVKPGFWMQPWTLMSPAMMGQFPAAALVFRQGLVAEGKLLAEINLSNESLRHLEGTPLPQDAALDELRLRDVPATAEVKPGQRLDPLLHYAGRVSVHFGTSPTSVRCQDLRPLIDHVAQIVRSSTGELTLDYGRGLLTLNAPKAQGITGALRAAGPTQTKDFVFTSNLELGVIVVVPLDGRPLAASTNMLLQVMSEEKTSGFNIEFVSPTTKRIVNIGHDPWLVKHLEGHVQFKRPDARDLKVIALDLNGIPEKELASTDGVTLRPSTVYYQIRK